jgi:hypothetical protein
MFGLKALDWNKTQNKGLKMSGLYYHPTAQVFNPLARYQFCCSDETLT